ncbi:hypothetical protein JKP88DRAFT_199312 [Tribonema minus]|uniref:Uncharacterized protein n=1 Tax=Tribonema minus TaxID=303371 RepID=A0A836CEN1_9STRA|nr:hypothetical protein JKP88DRAFT_199312 [Tribonema minus]
MCHVSCNSIDDTPVGAHFRGLDTIAVDATCRTATDHPSPAAAASQALLIEDILLHICSFQDGRRGEDWNQQGPDHGDLAAYNSHLSLLLSRPLSCSAKALEHAASAGNLPLLQHLYSSHPNLRQHTTDAFNSAAVAGHLHVLLWLHSELAPKITAWAIDGAAREGHLPVVRWLAQNGAASTVKAFNGAAANGHLAVAQYLHTQQGLTGTPWALDAAAMNGHLHAVQYIRANCRYAAGFTGNALDLAAINGHAAVVQWLLENTEDTWTRWGLEGATTGSHTRVAELLLTAGRGRQATDGRSSRAGSSASAAAAAAQPDEEPVE